MRYLLILLLLSGCGFVKYSTEAYIDGVKKAEVKSNVPSKVIVDGIEVDQRSSGSWFDRLLDKDIQINK